MSFVLPKTFSRIPHLLSKGFFCRATSRGAGEQQPPGAAGEWSKGLGDHFAATLTKCLAKTLLLCPATFPLCLEASFSEKFATGFNQLSLTVHQFGTSDIIYSGQ